MLDVGSSMPPLFSSPWDRYPPLLYCTVLYCTAVRYVRRPRCTKATEYAEGTAAAAAAGGGGGWTEFRTLIITIVIIADAQSK